MGRKEFLASLNPNKPRQSFTGQKGDLKIALQRSAAIALVSLTIIGAAGCTKAASKSHTTEPTTSQTMAVDNKYDYLNSPSAVLQDFKEHYIKSYNEANGTHYAPSQIELNYIQPDYLYKTNNGLVTHGNKPYETQSELDKFGNYSTISASIGNINLYQIIDKDTNKAIESFASFFSEDGYVEGKVFSGNDLNSLVKNLNENKDSTLENYIDLFKSVNEIMNTNNLNNSQKSKYISQLEDLEKASNENDR